MENQQVIEKLILDMQLRGLSKGTQKAYSESVAHFQEYFKKPATELWEQEIREYLFYLRNDKKLSTSAVNMCNCALRFLYEVTLEQNLSYKRIPRLKEPYTLPNIFTKDEIQAILNAADNLKHKGILMTIYGAGLRLSEITTIKVSNIDSKNMRIFIEQGKGKKDRYALLSQLNLDVLREYWKHYKPKHWLFEGMQKGSHISRRGVQGIFKKYLKKSGVQTEASVHTLRHSFATHLLENGTSLFYIRELLGHATIRTTTRYLHVASTDVLKTISPLDTLQKEGKPQKKRGRKPKIKEVPHFV
jgi:integrase/recombinase XerD